MHLLALFIFNPVTEPNSGFLGKTDAIEEQSPTFGNIRILSLRNSHFLAVGTRYGRRWCLKGVRREEADSTLARQRLLKEAEILSMLSHPGVVNFAGIEQVSGLGLCIIMEWIEGETLENALAEGKLSRNERHRLLLEIIESSAHLHSRGIVHRDIKPSNIMIRQNGGKAVIIDFDLADTDAHTVLKAPAGTAGYYSERQRTADTPYTGDDVFSLGVVMRALYPEYRSIIRRCTGNPERRYRDASALLQAVRRRERRATRRWIAAAIIAVIAITGSLVYHNRKLGSLVDEMGSQLSALSVRNSRQLSRGLQERRLLTDSIEHLSGRLEKEISFRKETERRERFMSDAKQMLKKQLENDYTAHIRDRNKPGFNEEYHGQKLIDAMTNTKSRILNKLQPLSESDRIELESTFAIYYGEILKRFFDENKI